MEPFLKKVADQLYAKYQSDIQEVYLVFPGRRAGLFFMQHYKEFVKDKPMWGPPIRTISELISELSLLQVVDTVILNFELYKVYADILKTDESFDSFYPFGEMLLNDFDDVDKYLVDTKQLFQNISDLRDIENTFSLTPEQKEIISNYWKNINLFEAGPVKKDYLTIWNRLHEIYEEFNRRLTKKGIAYEGKMYRQVCNDIKDGNIHRIQSRKYAIIGFNALNECEKFFFSYLHKNHPVDFFWDYDIYYTQNNWHEAGFFIRENLEKFPNSIPPSYFNHLSDTKDIQIVSAPSDVTQAKLLTSYLNDAENTPACLSDTLIVLADEQLLIPVLSSIPGNIKDVNVTLGYPFRLTQVYSFFDILLKLYKNIRISGNFPKYYHQDVMALLNHSYLQTICKEDCQSLINEIIGNNRIMISEEELQKNEYLKVIFNYQPDDFLIYLTTIAERLVTGLMQSTDINNETDFHIDYWYVFITTLNRLRDLLNQNAINPGMTLILSLLKKIINGLSIPFKGEPLAGLQIMGVLETRALDFETVIILSANEGVFPKSNSSPSYIPYNLRKGFGLPTIEHQDAIFAYYFYRIIQRAGKVVITYNSQPSNRAGEMSRFLYQLRYEKIFKINERNIGFSIHLSEEHPIIIHKDEKILKILKNYTDQGDKPLNLSPTALSAYMECSLRFYFRYIAGIKEMEEVIEDIEGSVFGKLLHYSVETLYKPFVGKLISTQMLDDIHRWDIIEKAVMEAFASEFFKNVKAKETLHGKSVIIKEILIKYIDQIIHVDKKNTPFTLLALEKKCEYQLLSDGNMVNIGGYIDRLDKKENLVRIIDYKTGMVEYSAPSITAIFDREGDTHKYAPIFQSMLYSLVISENPEYISNQVCPGLYGLRKIFSSDFESNLLINKQKVTDFGVYKQEYENELKKILSELFNEKTTFSKTTDKTKCENCLYKEICQR